MIFRGWTGFVNLSCVFEEKLPANKSTGNAKVERKKL